MSHCLTISHYCKINKCKIKIKSRDTIETELVTDEDIRKDLKQTSKHESGKNTLKSLRWFGFIII